MAVLASSISLGWRGVEYSFRPRIFWFSNDKLVGFLAASERAHIVRNIGSTGMKEKYKTAFKFSSQKNDL